MIDLGEVDFDIKNFADHIVTWDGLIDIAKEHLGNIAYFKLPGVIHQCGRDYDTMFLVRMDDGRLDSGLIKMEDYGKPSFSVSEDIMKDVNKYRRLHEKVFGFEPNVMLVFTHFDEVYPYYFDVTNGVFLDEVVGVTKKYGLKIRPIIDYCD